MAILQDKFWERMKSQETDRTRCLAAVQGIYDGYDMEEFEHQGYCSYTLLLTPRKMYGSIEKDYRITDSTYPSQLIVQLRPGQHALDLTLCWEAQKRHPTLVPTIRALDLYLPGLIAYQMEKLGGTPLSRLLHHGPSPGVKLQQKQETLIASFAKTIARSWPEASNRKRRDSTLYPVLPMAIRQTFLLPCTGKVGSCILQKLGKLAKGLPDEWLRMRAQLTLDKICMLDDYPVVLNHGDLIPSNILADEDTWEITGLVDWEEAEYLPFGTCLYGLEHLLGFLQSSALELGGPLWTYYDSAAQLRELFWTTLLGLVPALDSMKDDVRLMRDVGVFLWHGYAWDEGAIDRVVDEVNDSEELAKLRAFLSVS